MKKIAPYVSVFPCGSTGFYGMGYAQEYINDEHIWAALLAVTSEWKNPQTEESILKKFSSSIFSDILDQVLLKIKEKTIWLTFLAKNILMKDTVEMACFTSYSAPIFRKHRIVFHPHLLQLLAAEA